MYLVNALAIKMCTVSLTELRTFLVANVSLVAPRRIENGAT